MRNEGAAVRGRGVARAWGCENEGVRQRGVATCDSVGVDCGTQFESEQVRINCIFKSRKKKEKKTAQGL